MSHQMTRLYRFGPFTLNTAERLLLIDQHAVALEPKALDTLVVLVEHHGRLVGKEELLKRIWPDSFVEEVNLARNISLLRKALAQGMPERGCIETVPKHGYRFVAGVREESDEHEEAIAEEPVAPDGAASQGGEWRRKVAWSPWSVWLALSGLLLVAAIGTISVWAARKSV